jgi:LPS O-antigen subunit length determinant protein (WzzB/FepE family)
MQMDDLLAKLDNSAADIEKLREEKDQEIEILQAGMDSTIEQLNDARQVCDGPGIRNPALTFLQSQGLVDETTNAQIDTLILDNRKKLNQIIGMALSQVLISS